jgi:hypothetical protein
MRKNCKTFKEWIDSQVAEFNAAHHGDDHGYHLSASIWSTPLGGSVRCMIINDRRNKTGFASVSAKAYNDPTQIAIGLAWADYKGEEIPDFSIPLYKLGRMDKFEYGGETYKYLTTNPCLPDNIIVCDYKGFPFNFNRNTKVRIKEV